MAVYLIAQLSIHDRERYRRYEARFLDVLAKYDGRLLAVDDAPVALEGKWERDRVVLLEFPDADEAKRWMTSPEYQEIVGDRHAASEAIILQARGFPG